MAIPKKAKTNADLAYETQKFLKRFSIDFKFLKELTIWAEGDSFFFGSKLDNFFILEGKLKNPVENEFLNFVKESNNPVKIDFSIESFIALKKSLKKEVLSISTENNNLIITYEKEPFNLLIKPSEEFKNSIKGFNSERIEISSKCLSNTKLEYFKEKKKELEIPRKSIVGYTDGDFVFEREVTDGILAKSVLKYESDVAEFHLYFKAIK